MINRIAVIYMGGTFGCVGEPLSPMPAGQFIQHLETLDTHNIACQYFVAPTVVDSSRCTAQDWLKLVQFIHQLHQEYDFKKFVILHGTDTLSYATAIANRFIAPQLTVIFTGSQLPLLDVDGQHLRSHTDALNNLLFAIRTANTQTHGVYLAFHEQAIAHAQAIKMHTTAFHAFAEQNRNIAPKTHHIDFNTNMIEQVQHCSILNIMIQPIHLDILAQQLTQLLENPPHFLILQAYGTANLAVNETILQILKQLRQKECLTILTTQVPLGEIQQHYAITDWTKTADICLSDTQSHADLYAKCVQLYLQYHTTAERIQHWAKY